MNRGLPNKFRKIYGKLKEDKKKLSFVLSVVVVTAILSLPVMAKPVAKIFNLTSPIKYGEKRQIIIDVIFPDQNYIPNFNPNEISKIYLLDGDKVVAESVGNVSVRVSYSTYGYTYGYEYPMESYGYGYETYSYGYYGYNITVINAAKFIADFVFLASPGTYTIDKVELCESFSNTSCTIIDVQNATSVQIIANATTSTSTSTEENNMPVYRWWEEETMPPAPVSTPTAVTNVTKVLEEMGISKIIQSIIPVKNITSVEVTYNATLEVKPVMNENVTPMIQKVISKLEETVKTNLKQNISIKIQPVETKTIVKLIKIKTANGQEKIYTEIEKIVTSKKVVEVVPKTLAKTANDVIWVKGKVLSVLISDPVFEVSPDNNTIAYLVEGNKTEYAKETVTATYTFETANKTTTVTNITTPSTVNKPAQPTTPSKKPAQTTETVNKTSSTTQSIKSHRGTPYLIYIMFILLVLFVAGVVVVIFFFKKS